jgi:hypothetical protein
MMSISSSYNGEKDLTFSSKLMQSHYHIIVNAATMTKKAKTEDEVSILQIG